VDTTWLEHRREWRTEETRISGVERELAILQTKFEGALERAVSGDDLKDLKREVDDNMKQTVHNIRDYFDGKTDQQSRDILQQVQLLLAQERQASVEDQRQFRRQLFFTLFAWGLGIIGTVMTIFLTTRG
jgi:hypothetical protein